MPIGGPLEVLPLWGVFLATLGLILVWFEIGRWLGMYRRRRSAAEDRTPFGEIVSATLALLAFLLAFTFGLAASRYETRRGLSIDEVNAIGTSHLRAGLLAEPHRSAVRGLLREYTAVRLEAMQPGKLAHCIERSERIHAELWAHVEAVGSEQPNVVIALFITSVNQLIDLHSSRVAQGTQAHIPTTIWTTLYFVSAVGMGVIGYHAGIAAGGRSPATLGLALAFAAVMTLIADLDRPLGGFLRVSPQPLMDLRRSMGQDDRRGIPWIDNLPGNSATATAGGTASGNREID